MAYASGLVSENWGKIYFYLNPERKHPAPIPERQMNNFILVTSVSDDLIPLGEVTQELLKGDKVRVIGGTGSFGNAVLNRFLRTDIGEIRIFSRDEKKQDDMRHEYQAKMPEVD